MTHSVHFLVMYIVLSQTLLHKFTIMHTASKSSLPSQLQVNTLYSYDNEESTKTENVAKNLQT